MNPASFARPPLTIDQPIDQVRNRDRHTPTRERALQVFFPSTKDWLHTDCFPFPVNFNSPFTQDVPPRKLGEIDGVLKHGDAENAERSVKGAE